MNILKEVSLGQYHFIMAKLLRETNFLSSMLVNSETWVNMSETDINTLESIDRVLLRQIYSVPKSTPSAALYLELGCIPIRFILQAKRIMYLKYILGRDDNDLLKKVFKAQLNKPAKNDWILTVKEDLKYFEIKLTLEDIKKRPNLK